jgi:hypothetical protein
MEKDETILNNLKDALWDYYEEIFWRNLAQNNEDEKGRDVYCERRIEEALKTLNIDY